MSVIEKDKLEEIVDILEKVNQSFYIGQTESILAAYTKAVEMLEQKRIAINNAINMLNDIID